MALQKPWIVPRDHKAVAFGGEHRAETIRLTPDDLDEIDSTASQITVQGARYPEHLEQFTAR
jgi:hypothetical protein